MKKIFLLIYLLFASLTIFSQSGRIFGRIFTTTTEGTGAEQEVITVNGKSFLIQPIPEAVVELILNTDTLRTVTNQDGEYQFRNIRYGTYQIIPRHITYLSDYKSIRHNTPITVKDIQMTEETIALNSITVKGDIPLLKLEKDTLVINPKAVAVMGGDAAIEIIKQVPGMSVDERSGQVMAFGKPLARTYVGGKLVFGENALDALIHLDAALVSKMKVYDEVTSLDFDAGAFKARTRRVMNIETTRQIINSRTGHIALSTGSDLPGKTFRYKAGGTLNFFSEHLITSANVFKNNTGLTGNAVSDFQNLQNRGSGNRDVGHIGVRVEKVFGERSKNGAIFNLLYTFNNRKEDNISQTQLLYFPSATYQNREYSGTALNFQKENKHTVNLSYTHFKKIKYNISHQMGFKDSRDENFIRSINRIDNRSEQIATRREVFRNGWNVQDQLTGYLFRENLKIHLSSDLSGNNGSTWNADTLASSLTEKVYRSSPVGQATLLNGNLYYSLFSNCNLALEYDIRYQNSQSKEIRLNEASTSVAEDLANSHHYTVNKLTHSATLHYHLLIPDKKNTKERHRIITSISFRSTSITDIETVPKPVDFIKTYNTVLFSAAYTHSKSKEAMYFWNVRYNTQVAYPSLEQLREQIDNRNPVYLTAGNFSLKQTYVHLVNGNIRRIKGSKDMGITVGFTAGFNSIVPKQKLYTQEEILHEYNNYKVMPGTTLTTYKNLNGTLRADVTTYYSFRIAPLKTTITADAIYKYQRAPSFINEVQNITNSHSFLLGINWLTVIKKLSLNFSTKSEYVNSINTHKAQSNYFNEELKLGIRWDIGKYLYARGNYNYLLYHPLSEHGTGFSNHILNAATGVKILKGKLEIGFSVFDLLNKSTNFTTVMYSDYVQNTWKPTFGRYWSFDFLFKFRSAKSASGRLNDGSANYY